MLIWQNPPNPKKLIEVANQVAKLSTSESIPLEDVENHVKRKEEEKQRIDEEIEHKRAILESTNVEIETIDKDNQLEEELNKFGLSTEDPKRLVAVLDNIKNLRYDPKKIIAEFSSPQFVKTNRKILEEQVPNTRKSDVRR